MHQKAVEMAEQIQKHFTGPMTEEEVRFLRDVQGFIEFAIRNGLSFPVVVAAVGYDMNELARDLFDLPQAKVRGFRPKVDGYCEISEADFGESDEPLD